MVAVGVEEVGLEGLHGGDEGGHGLGAEDVGVFEGVGDDVLSRRFEERAYLLSETRDRELPVGVDDHDAGLAPAEVVGEDGVGGKMVEDTCLAVSWVGRHEFDDWWCLLGLLNRDGGLDEAIEGGKTEE